MLRHTLNIDWQSGIDSNARWKAALWYRVRCCGCCWYRFCCCYRLPLLTASDFKSDFLHAAAVLLRLIGVRADEDLEKKKSALSLAFNRTRLLIINCSPDTAGAVGTVSVFNHTVFVLAGLIGTRCSVMMLLATRIQALAQRTLNGEISAWLWLEMAIVYLHLHDSHKLNLTC